MYTFYFEEHFIALVKTTKACISPYERIGKQCLYFSRPYEPWGITKSWDQVGRNESRDGFWETYSKFMLRRTKASMVRQSFVWKMEAFSQNKFLMWKKP